MQDSQAETEALLSGRSKQPLANSNSANDFAPKLAQSQPGCNLSIAGALRESLLTPAKGTVSKPPLRSASAIAQDENTPPHAAVSPAIKHSNIESVCERQSSFVSNSTPTSVFRRLNTRSPSVTCTDRAPDHALTQLSEAKLDSMPSGMHDMAANGQKRARPVQRGIHPAEINKRITNAQECWHILDIVTNFGADFDAVNVATALHRIAKQRPDDSKKLVASDTFRQLVMMVDIQVMACSLLQVQTATNTCWRYMDYGPCMDNVFITA